MDEQQLVNEVALAERDYANAQLKMVKAKRVWTEAESEAIEAKIRCDRCKEQLKALRKSMPTSILDAREQEIQAFREKMEDLLKKV